MMERRRLEQEMDQRILQSGRALSLGPHRNYIQNFFFPDQVVLEANHQGKLLVADLDVGDFCDLNCDNCYVTTRSNDHVDYVESIKDRVKGIINEAVPLGLKVIKVVGAGEPTLFSGLLDIIHYAHNQGVGSLVYTAGHVIGDDNLAGKIFKKEGIATGLEIVEKLNTTGSSVIVKYSTFNDDLQNKLVPVKDGKRNYAQLRDKGLLRLVEAGFNADGESRLGIAMLLLQANYREAGEIFQTFNRYNIFSFVTTPVNTGGTADDKKNPCVPTKDQVFEAIHQIHAYCLESGLDPQPQSTYIAGPPCNQLYNGLHFGSDGTVKTCPGANIGIAKYEPGNLKAIWQENLKRQEKYEPSVNNGCPPRAETTMSSDLVRRVAKNLAILGNNKDERKIRNLFL